MLDIASSDGSSLALLACVSGSSALVDSEACTGIAHGRAAQRDHLLTNGALTSSLRPMPPAPLFECARVGCSARTAAAAAEGLCAAGTRTYIMDAVSPDGLRPGDTLP